MTAIAGASTAQAQFELPEPDPSRFQKVLLEDTGLNEPVRLAVAPDGRVIFIERRGAVKVWSPVTQETKLAGTVPTQATGETGLMGLTLAPDFSQTGHVYLGFALPGFGTTGSPNFRQERVSRFTLTPANELDLSSEVKIMDRTNRGGGGHSGGDLEMTPDGILFISTGDNTGCCASAGYAPHDERPGQESNDAQRTSGNTNDLNGKLLRIRPLAQGGYEIPEGNLFPESQDTENKTRPEIYAMGFRNLFSIGDYDPETKSVWIGDYGPDAALDSETRGPRGYVRGVLATEAGNYGWPYCTANQQPYIDWDYATATGKGPFNCAAPVNDSPNNTGLRNLPPIKDANLYYSYTAQEPWPMLYGGGFHAGPRYKFDPASTSPTKFPAWFDGRRFFMEFTTNFIGSTAFGDDNATPEDVRLHFPSMRFGAPFDARFGPDGSMYLLEYGANSFSNTKIGTVISRIDYVEGNRTPLVSAKVTPDAGGVPLTAEFDASASQDPDGDDLTFSWDFDRDGTPDATGAKVSHTFSAAGTYTPRVTVTDEHGTSAIGNLQVTVGNSRPVVEFLSPLDGDFAEFTGPIPFKVKVTDVEDGTVDCTDVEVSYSLGHDAHAHPLQTVSPNANCEGTITPIQDGSHAGSSYVYHVIEAKYVDAGGIGGTPALEGSDTAILHPRAYQAQQAQDDFGVTKARAVYNMGVSGAYLMYPHVNLANVDRVNFEISGELGSVGGNWTLRADSPTGPVIARRENLPDTGTQFWVFGAVFRWLSAPIDDPGGVHDLYVVVDYPEGVTPGRVTLRNFEFINDLSSVSATLEPAAPNGSGGWYTAPVGVRINTGGQVGWTGQTSIDNGTTWQNANAQGVSTINADGSHTVLYRATDKAGTIAPGGSVAIKVDRTAPVTTAAVDPAAPGANGWYTVAPTVTLSAADPTSGVAKTEYRIDGGTWQTYSAPFAVNTYGEHVVEYRSTDAAGNAEAAKSLALKTNVGVKRDVGVGGTVPGTLALNVGGSASFGAFQPGVAREYTTTLGATVTSTAGDATLTVADPDTGQPGRLVNGPYALAQPVQAKATGASATGGAFAPIANTPLTLLTYAGPVSNAAATIDLKQAIGSSESLRSGTYGKTVTFTLSTNTP